MVGVFRRHQYGRASSGGGGTAPALTGMNVTCGASGTSGSVTIPSGAKVGDIILLAALCATSSSPVTPTGYSLVASVTCPTNGTTVVNKIFQFSKVAVAGDIGASVTVTGLVSSFPWSLIARTYTSSGIDSSNTAASDSGSSLAVPALTSTVPNEVMVTFGQIQHQGQSTSSDGFDSGGSNVFAEANTVTAGFQWIGVEDWTLPTVGSGATGGAIHYINSGSQGLTAVSVTLKP